MNSCSEKMSKIPRIIFSSIFELPIFNMLVYYYANMSAAMIHPAAPLTPSFSQGLTDGCIWTFLATVSLGEQITYLIANVRMDRDSNIILILFWSAVSIGCAFSTCSKLFDATYILGSEATRKRIRQITAQFLGSALATICIDIVPYYARRTGLPHLRVTWIVVSVLIWFGAPPRPPRSTTTYIAVYN
jgi:hypothetical protein